MSEKVRDELKINKKMYKENIIDIKNKPIHLDKYIKTFIIICLSYFVLCCININ